MIRQHQHNMIIHIYAQPVIYDQKRPLQIQLQAEIHINVLWATIVYKAQHQQQHDYQELIMTFWVLQQLRYAKQLQQVIIQALLQQRLELNVLQDIIALLDQQVLKQFLALLVLFVQQLGLPLHQIALHVLLGIIVVKELLFQQFALKVIIVHQGLQLQLNVQLEHMEQK